MRKLLLQDITAIKRKKRLLSIQEVFEQGGYVYTAERKVIFRVKESHSFKDGQMANKWVLKKIKDSNEPKRLSLLRVCNKGNCESLWRSKLAGRLYIMRNNTVLAVSFLQVFKVVIKQGELTV